MNKLQLSIILDAIKIKIKNGEDLNIILNKYNKLSEDDKNYILNNL